LTFTTREREQAATRLLEASAKHSHDPETELDWEAPFEEGKYFWPPELCSLYGTPLWKHMSEEQRIELSRHESASLASIGIWFEIILMQCCCGTPTTSTRPARTSDTRSPKSPTSAAIRRCSPAW
jgi:hypothetical protein